jgi:signal transduction histidine kinase
MRPVVLTCLIILLVFGKAKAEIDLEPTAQNFTKMMKLQNPSDEEIMAIIQLSIAYSYSNKDSCLQLGERSLELAANKKALHAEALIELGDSYRIFGDYEKAERLLIDGREIFVELKEREKVAVSDNKLGALMKNLGNDEKAIEYYLSALSTWQDLKDSANIIKPYINIATILQDTDRPLLALEYNQYAYEIAELMDDDLGKGFVANNVALIYIEQAEKFNSIADTIAVGANLYRDSAFVMTEMAVDNYAEALEIAQESQNNIEIIRVLGNIADLKFDQGKFEEALEINSGLEELTEDHGAALFGIIYRTRQCKIYSALGDQKKAIEFGEDAVKRATELNIELNTAQAHRELTIAYKRKGDFEKALASFEIYKAYSDNMNAAERKKAIDEIESRYQSIQKAKKILEQQNNILALEDYNSRIRTQRNFVYTGIAIFILLSITGFWVFSLKRERNDKIAFTEALIYAQEEERKRIARDLHDGVGQSLLLINQQLTNNQKSIFDNQELITETLEEVRSISRDLHPFQLDKLGLTAAIENMLLRVQSSSNLFVSKEIENINGLVDKKSELHLYRVIQEALNNVMKHAEAKAVKLTISRNNREINIEIMDNGNGFSRDLKKAPANSLGLRTMRERVSSLGGELNILKVEPKGSNIQVKVPINKDLNV